MESDNQFAKPSRQRFPGKLFLLYCLRKLYKHFLQEKITFSPIPFPEIFKYAFPWDGSKDGIHSSLPQKERDDIISDFRVFLQVQPVIYFICEKFVFCHGLFNYGVSQLLVRVYASFCHNRLPSKHIASDTVD